MKKGCAVLEICVLSRDSRIADVAERSGIEPGVLMEINGLERPGLLPRGMSLLMPGEKEACGEAREGEVFLGLGRAAGAAVKDLSYAAAEFEPGERAAEREGFLDFAANRGALPVYMLTARGELPETRALICSREQGSSGFLERLASELAEAGYGALGLDFSRLLPFDREAFTQFAARAGEAAHKNGLWFICVLPLYREETRLGRANAAYDAGDLGAVADRLIVQAGGLMGAAEMERGLEYICSHVPGGRLLAGIREGARLHRYGTVEHISARCAQNLAVTAGARIGRSKKGEPAEFFFRDKTGAMCRVEYGDALWAQEICRLCGKYSLAGLARRAGQGPGCGAERVLEGCFSPEKIL